MTEAEWLACTDPQPMLDHLRGKTSDRKLRLFLCACCRNWWEAMPEGPSRDAVEAAEHYADGPELAAPLAAAAAAVQPVEDALELGSSEQKLGITTSVAAVTIPAEAGVGRFSLSNLLIVGAAVHHGWQCALLRDIFGNPFRPAPCINPAWLRWHGGAIPQLAQAIYDERILPAGTFDPARLALLADMLTDAGCTDADILEHCRSGGEHVRGCWVVDLLLGKE
jgi:hypothetical protein